ncbi:DUF3040 domain-containing protein [Amycolatopsis jiangsuensis]|uniref:DUF3040 family protein n=1 Tax=Amycolatopsis jiangsuensis TaxID=1181879 RepID=A0A840IPV6_9PSEU|nr:DUF3040 domain-containing protein [Amycolatopsis jiangsuensis]MBB4683074.1 hypothetical protein [Amycolatopsis jiangsuensis]
MLPHHDRSALRKIEEELAASDPEFAAALSHGAPPARSRLWFVTLILADLAALLMIVFGLTTGDTGLFLWGFVATPALVWAHRIVRQHTQEDTQEDAAGES